MSATQFESQPRDEDMSEWSAGAIMFAATAMVLVGVFQVLTGLVAIIDDEFYVVTRNYTFDFDVTAWGWIHLLLGAVVLATGVGLFTRSNWANVVAIMIVTLSAIANFLFIPYYPLWALLLIGVDLWILWALTRPGALVD